MSRDEVIRIKYGMERLLWQEPDDDQLDVWLAQLDVGEVPDDDDVDIQWDTVATATLYGIDPARSASVGHLPFDVADAHSADAAYYYEHVFGVDGNLLSDVEGQFELVTGRALFLHDVVVTSARRRRGYASLLVADVLLTLAADGTAVLAHPGPTDVSGDEEDEVGRLRRETQNTRFLGALGFTPFRDRLWVLDLSLQDAADRLARIRRGNGR